MYNQSDESCPNCGFREGISAEGIKPDWAYLTTVKNDLEFGMVAGLLEMANIPVLREVKGVDAYVQVLLGVPLSGVHVLVPGDRLDEAVGLLGSSAEDNEMDEEDKDIDAEDKEMNKEED